MPDLRHNINSVKPPLRCMSSKNKVVVHNDNIFLRPVPSQSDIVMKKASDSKRRLIDGRVDVEIESLLISVGLDGRKRQ